MDKLELKILNMSQHYDSIISIADFRRDDLQIYCENFYCVKTFLSSGTTSQLTSRSKSRFSFEGLKKYRQNALENFFAIPGLPKKGISLIPSTATWPDSSLAQMMEWIAEECEVIYFDEKTLEKNAYEQIWIFGTAFHYVNLFDSGFKNTLPLGSYIFETGGTKNQSREVSNLELECMIKTLFGNHTFFGEYGMCELASQAYGEKSVESQFLRFPKDVKLTVLKSDRNLYSEGIGILCLKDSSRVDIEHAILTEDRVQLFKDQSFYILGRVEKAPLKGCSLNLSNLIQANLTPQISHVHVDTDRKKLVFAKIADFFSQQEKIFDLLKEELKSDNLAKSALKDLLKSIPKTAEEFQNALDKSGGKNIKNACFILPANHSLVGLYPLSLALGLGIELHVKPSQKKLPLLDFFLKTFSEHITLLNADFRFTGEKVSFTRIFVYGDQETKVFFDKYYPEKSKVFGPGITVTVATGNNLNVKKLIYDSISLRQKGCKSCRGLIILDSGDKSWIDDFQTEIRLLSAGDSDSSTSSGLLYSYLFQENHYLSKPDDGFLLIRKHIDDIKNGNFFTSQEFTLPVCWLNFNEFFEQIEKTSINRILIDPQSEFEVLNEFEKNRNNSKFSDEFSHLEFVRPGTSQIVPWDGFYEGKPIFL